MSVLLRFPKTDTQPAWRNLDRSGLERTAHIRAALAAMNPGPISAVNLGSGASGLEWAAAKDWIVRVVYEAWAWGGWNTPTGHAPVHSGPMRFELVSPAGEVVDVGYLEQRGDGDPIVDRAVAAVKELLAQAAEAAQGKVQP
jgi:hypothetical protein